MNNIFSIVTPSFNQGKYIEQTIKSVIFQAGNFYIDYIIADGGSKDETINIIKKYDRFIKSQDFRKNCLGVEFRWLSEPDSGQSNAINKGFKVAKGDICAWINSDDWYEKDAFAEVLNSFNKNADVDMVYGNVYHYYENGSITKGEASPSDFEKNLFEGCQISQQGAFFSKNSLVKAGYLDESLHYSMDYDLWLKILNNSKAFFAEKHLAYFRFWPDSKTCSQKKGFEKEEKLLRKKYGGSIFNPMSIHRMRNRIFLASWLKKNCPVLYKTIKKIVYKSVNLLKYKN